MVLCGNGLSRCEKMKLNHELQKLCCTCLIVGEGAVRVDGVDAGDDGADPLPFQDPLLLPLGEQGDLVVHVLQDDEDRRLAGQLLGTVVLEWRK